MEPHRTNGSPDIRVHRGYAHPHSRPRSSPDNLFGVRVQIQGIKGRPYVVMNSNDQESHGDVPAHHSENLGPRRGASLDRTLDEGPAVRRGQLTDSTSTPDFRDSGRTVAANTLHYQRHPELLRPYDPEENNLNLLLPSQTTADARADQTHAQTTQAGSLPLKARVPLPAGGPVPDRSESRPQEPAPPGEAAPLRSPNSVETDTISSVGKLIDRFNSTQRKRGRFGPRNRIDLDDRQRSRSVDSRQNSDSSTSSSASSSFSSSRTSSSLRGAREPGTLHGDERDHHHSPTQEPGTVFFGGGGTLQASRSRRQQSSSTTQLYAAHHGKESSTTTTPSPQATKPMRNGVERGSPPRSKQANASNHVDETQEREAQVKSFTTEYVHAFQKDVFYVRFGF